MQQNLPSYTKKIYFLNFSNKVPSLIKDYLFFNIFLKTFATIITFRTQNMIMNNQTFFFLHKIVKEQIFGVYNYLKIYIFKLLF